MTPTEAGELVLAGPQWMKCPDCKTGMQTVLKDYIHENPEIAPAKVNVNITCTTCEGCGAVIPPEYAEAIALLDLPHPERWTRTALMGGAFQLSGPEHLISPFPGGPTIRYGFTKNES
jgi:hypothetical protein